MQRGRLRHAGGGPAREAERPRPVGTALPARAGIPVCPLAGGGAGIETLQGQSGHGAVTEDHNVVS
ncbi:MAG: hypothetical protein LUP91_15895, partial [Methylococcaceae bacterium]|nr:hypothetical protein [Methylococcaceae bacterium]